MKKNLLGITLAVIMLLSNLCTFAQAAEDTAEEKFGDISTHWSRAAINTLYKTNSIPFLENNFYPDKAITKSEFAVMLHDALGIQINYFVEPDITDYYTDVRQDAVYAYEVIDLVSAGIFESGGSFNPDSSLPREELIHYVIEAFNFKAGDMLKMIKIAPASFSDTSSVSPELSGDIAIAQHFQLIIGDGNNMFMPKKSASRAETAVVVCRLLELLDKQNLQVTVKPEAVLKENSIEMKILVVNNTDKAVYIEHSSGQLFDFALYDADKESLYRWSADKLFPAVMTTTKIEAGETLVFSETLSEDAYLLIKDEIVYFKAFITGSADFLHSEGYEITLK